MAKDFYVAIIGKPNTGKSTLFNRLAGARLAIVSKVAHTTRDRKIVEIQKQNKRFFLIDTAGFISKYYPKEETDILTQKQVEIAIATADFIIFLVDNQTGSTIEDEKIAKLLHRVSERKKVLLVANKSEGKERKEFYDLGFGKPLYISALHGTQLGFLLQEILKNAPPAEEEKRGKEIKVTIIGRPNVGKSTLLNSLAGEERAIVSQTPGTTRDTIDAEISFQNQMIRFVDTAGIVRKYKQTKEVAYFAILRAFEALQKSDIALLVLDASEGIARFDKKLAEIILEFERGVILVVNKWDLEKRDGLFRIKKELPETQKEDLKMRLWISYLQEELPHLFFAPVVFISAKNKENLKPLLQEILIVARNTPSKLNAQKLAEITREIKGESPSLPDDLKLSQDNKVKTLFYASSKRKLPLSQKRHLLYNLQSKLGWRGWGIRIIQSLGPLIQYNLY